MGFFDAENVKSRVFRDYMDGALVAGSFHEFGSVR